MYYKPQGKLPEKEEANATQPESATASMSFPENSQARLDKRSSNLSHTVITTQLNKKFELVGSLTQEEMNELRQQTKVEIKADRGKVVLGAGFFGKVRLAKDNHGKYLAIKKIKNPSSAVVTEEKVHDILREKHIHHVMIPEASIETVNSKGTPTLYQFMPLADFGDGDLFRIALLEADINQKERGFLLASINRIIISAFEEMHLNGVCHLDFKPANLLFDAKGNPYVSDFGSSLTQVERSEHYVISATDIVFWSPEFLYIKKKDVTGEDMLSLDNWRLGLTLLHISYPEISLKDLKSLMSETYKKVNQNDSNAPDYLTLATKMSKLIDQIGDQLESLRAPLYIKNIIKGLLTVDPKKRMTSHQAYNEIKKLHQPKRKVIENIFSKVLAQRPFAEFVINVRKWCLLEKKMIEAGSAVDQSQLGEYKPYFTIVQNVNLNETQKLAKLRAAFKQFNEANESKKFRSSRS